MDNTIYIIGIRDGELQHKQKEILSYCKYVFGTKRFQKLTKNIIFCPITPLNDAIEKIKKYLLSGNVAVFASGDPLFYGIGKTIMNHLPDAPIVFLPSLSSIQRAAALFHISWDDAHLVSFHGRRADNLPNIFLSQHKTIALTDNINSPNYIAQSILNYLKQIGYNEEVKRWQIYVAENIDGDDENVFKGTLEECAKREFHNLNIFCMHHRKQPEIISPISFSFGLSEDDIKHSRGLITKSEVRAATLHALRLPQAGVLWDVGAGSGSISIEAGRINPTLKIFAIEHKKEEIENIKTNIRRYRCFNVIPVFGHAPEIMQNLPNPNSIFVGGSSGTLQKIVEIAKNRLDKNGRIVINGVIEKTIQSAPLFLEKYNFSWESSEMHICRKNSDGIQQFNPITITIGTHKEGAI